MRAQVATLVILALIHIHSVHCLFCHCTEVIVTELPFPPVGCFPNSTCWTDTGRCYVDLTIVENGVKKYTYHCIEDRPSDHISLVHTTCSLSNPSSTQVVLCCNDTDFCNWGLNPDEKLLTDPPMSPSPTPRLTDKTTTPSASNEGLNLEVVVGSVGAVVIVIVAVISITSLVVFIRNLYIRKS